MAEAAACHIGVLVVYRSLYLRNYSKAVFCMVAELYLFDNFGPKYDLDLLYQGHSKFCPKCMCTVSTDGFNYKAVSCMVAELWLFEKFGPKFDLFFIKVIQNDVIHAHLQCSPMVSS